MKNIQIGTESFSMATSWADLLPDQRLKILPLTLMDLDQMPVGEAALVKYKVAKALIGAPEELMEKLDAGQRWRLMRLASWVFTTKPETRAIEGFDFEGVRYQLPADSFADTSAIEVAMANIHYLAYTRAQAPVVSAVFQLVATLCRPIRKDLKAFQQSPEWNGDQREVYNTIKADERALAFQAGGLDIAVVIAVLYHFEFQNNRFLDAYKLAYEPSEDPDEPPLYQNGEGLVTTFMDIAKENVFGDFENVCKQNAHTVWLFLRDNNLKIRRANRRAQEQASNDERD